MYVQCLSYTSLCQRNSLLSRDLFYVYHPTISYLILKQLFLQYRHATLPSNYFLTQFCYSFSYKHSAFHSRNFMSSLSFLKGFTSRMQNCIMVLDILYKLQIFCHVYSHMSMAALVSLLETKMYQEFCVLYSLWQLFARRLHISSFYSVQSCVFESFNICVNNCL